VPPAYRPPITIVQTADPNRYAEMLRCSRTINECFARRAGVDYLAYLGVRRGFFPWHATFNRISILKDMLDAGYNGWVFYIDADAYVADLDFDLRGYLDRHAHHWMIAAPGSANGPKWEVNAGVFLLNFQHPSARRFVELLHANFTGTRDEQLAASPNWYDVQCDQERLHNVLIANPELQTDLFVEDRSFFNSQDARFLRQVLRQDGMSLDQRLTIMRSDIAAILDAAGEGSGDLALGGRPARSEGGPPDPATAAALISTLYREILGRTPDPHGLEFYVARIQQFDIVEGLQSVMHDMLQSEEFRERFASGDKTVHRLK
jgi:hypothetical protein